MKKKIIHTIFGFLLFISACIGEAYIRSHFTEAIPIQNFEHSKIKIEAYKKPDFLWLGESWWINIESNSATELTLDLQHTLSLTSGETKVFSNHDMNNTGDIGSTKYIGTPKSITVKLKPNE